MREMSQGETYDESEFEEGADLDTEASEDTSTNITTIYGIPKHIFIIVVAAVLLVLIFIVVLALRKNSKSDSDVVEPNAGDYYEVSTPSIETTDCFVGSEYVGYISGSAYYGANIYASAGNVYATLQQTGEVAVTDPFGTVLGYVSGTGVVDTAPTDTTPTTDMSSLSLSEESMKLLRKYGYTGDEIKLAVEAGLSTDDLIAEAQLLHDELAKESLERMADHASEEFQSIINTTQYCMPYQEYFSTMWDQEGYINEQGSYVVNADYEKIPTYGYQLRVKVKIANGTYAFLDVLPQRYGSMPDSGNIVVQVNYMLFGQAPDHVQFYITSIVERDITNLTVNPQDSGIDLNTIIN